MTTPHDENEWDGVLELARSWEQTAIQRQEEKVTLLHLVHQMESFIMEHCSWHGVAAHLARKAVRTRWNEVHAALRDTTPTLYVEQKPEDIRSLVSDLDAALEHVHAFLPALGVHETLTLKRLHDRVHAFLNSEQVEQQEESSDG